VENHIAAEGSGVVASEMSASFCDWVNGASIEFDHRPEPRIVNVLVDPTAVGVDRGLSSSVGRP
jgi:hypothetical protein